MSDYYERALARITLVTAGLGIAGTLAALVARGPRWAAGFLVGAVISLLNFHGWKRLADWLSRAARPERGAAVLLTLRYLLFAGIVYAIVKLLGITVAAILAGLFVSVAAIILEILYELIYART